MKIWGFRWRILVVPGAFVALGLLAGLSSVLRRMAFEIQPGLQARDAKEVMIIVMLLCPLVYILRRGALAPGLTREGKLVKYLLAVMVAPIACGIYGGAMPCLINCLIIGSSILIPMALFLSPDQPWLFAGLLAAIVHALYVAKQYEYPAATGRGGQQGVKGAP